MLSIVPTIAIVAMQIAGSEYANCFWAMNLFVIFLGLAVGLMFEPNVDVPLNFTFDETDQSGRFVVHEKGGQPMVVYVKNEVDPVSCFRSVPILSES